MFVVNIVTNVFNMIRYTVLCSLYFWLGVLSLNIVLLNRSNYVNNISLRTFRVVSGVMDLLCL